MNPKQIKVASKEIPAELVIKNAKIVDVFNLEILSGDVAVVGGMIVGIGDYEGENILDAKGRYLVPGLIDAHVHIESSMTIPSQFAEAVLPHGVTTVITDPHEIANVSGADGIQFMLNNSEGLPLDVRVMLPSCVPATPFENSGAVLNADDLLPFYNHPRVLGLAEVMDYPSVKNQSSDMMKKLQDAQPYPIDGHGAGFDTTALNVYRTAGIRTDHECTTAEDALDRVRRGFYVQIREGSAAKNLKALLPAVIPRNSHRFLFCTDDRHLDELIAEGSIDENIRLAVKLGLDPLMAIQMATLNAAQCYGLHTKGAIAPGYEADFLLVDAIDRFRVFETYVKGELVAREGVYLASRPKALVPASLQNTVKLPPIDEKLFTLKLQGEKAHVIGIIPGSIVTEHLILPVDSDDLLKLAVIERHKNTGNVGVGLVKGFGLKRGAVAATIAHDSHNLMVVGTNDADMVAAALAMEKLQGGIAIVDNGAVLASLPLPIGGLMSDAPLSDISNKIKSLSISLQKIGFTKDFDFLLTLAFLSLPVIPSLKLTQSGLFDVGTFTGIGLDAGN
ncbi:MAG: adenine deaminase [Turicibacter sp.]|nr:adenine deaminase [Turicibacter sp.]